MTTKTTEKVREPKVRKPKNWTIGFDFRDSTCEAEEAKLKELEDAWPDEGDFTLLDKKSAPGLDKTRFSL